MAPLDPFIERTHFIENIFYIGKLYTVAPLDLFKMIDQQFEVVDALALEKSTFALAVTVCQVLLGDTLKIIIKI